MANHWGVENYSKGTSKYGLVKLDCFKIDVFEISYTYGETCKVQVQLEITLVMHAHRYANLNTYLNDDARLTQSRSTVKVFVTEYVLVN